MSEEEANEIEQLHEYLEKEHAEVKYNKQVSSETFEMHKFFKTAQFVWKSTLKGPKFKIYCNKLSY